MKFGGRVFASAFAVGNEGAGEGCQDGVFGGVADAEAKVALTSIQKEFARLENGRDGFVIELFEINVVVEQCDEVAMVAGELFNAVNSFHLGGGLSVFVEQRVDFVLEVRFKEVPDPLDFEFIHAGLGFGLPPFAVGSEAFFHLLPLLVLQ